MNDIHEKRQISRAYYQLSCTMVIGGISNKCAIRNISLTGLLVETEIDSSIVVGKKASLILEHFCPENRVSEISCEIVRVSGRFLGLKVSAIDYDTFIKIKDLLSQLIPEKGKVDMEILKMLEEKKENELHV